MEGAPGQAPSAPLRGHKPPPRGPCKPVRHQAAGGLPHEPCGTSSCLPACRWWPAHPALRHFLQLPSLSSLLAFCLFRLNKALCLDPSSCRGPAFLDSLLPFDALTVCLGCSLQLGGLLCPGCMLACTMSIVLEPGSTAVCMAPTAGLLH